MYEYLLLAHEKNIQSKINDNYHGLGSIIEQFYNEEYLPMRARIYSLIFDDNHRDSFIQATTMINEYYRKLIVFRETNSISSQSKWDSSFLEEISSYLVKDVPEIANGDYGIYNKRIYAGLKIDSNRHIATITKDVDFCIGKKATVTIENQEPIDLLLPIVAVEVKTYLDATMFGEVKSSSKAIRSASPNSKTYVLMGYKNIADEHLLAARQDSTLTEIFILQAEASADFDANTLYLYWKEITNAISNVTESEVITAPGRVLKP